MQIEDVAGVGLAARRATEQERHGAVGLGLLGEVIKHDEHVLAGVHPVLADGRTRVGGEVLEPGRVRGWCGHDGRVLHGAVLLERTLDGGDRRTLLADCYVDAANLLVRVARQPVLALVQDRVEAHCGLAGLAVTDDELALSTPDRRHGINRLDTRLQRLLDGLTLDDGRSLQFEHATRLGLDRAKTIDRVAERIDHAAEEGITDRHRENFTGAAHGLAFGDLRAIAEEHDTDFTHVQVQGETKQATLELQQLVGHCRVEAFNAGNAVAGLDDSSNLFTGGCRRVRRDVPLDRIPDLFRSDRQLRHGVLLSFSAHRGRREFGG
ncbi:unannotated protein [freshwater metagenome]|uniref:Unannotated protein n=1 Tax=freshwater metagenome TaxID=449393 RepID=A0A6J7DC36_9ZZZZ